MNISSIHLTNTLHRHSEHGAALVFYIITLIVLGVLSAGMLTLFSTATSITTSLNHSKYAYYMAESGVRYGASMMKSDNTLAAKMALINSIPDYTVDTAQGFELEVYALGTLTSKDDEHTTPGGYQLVVAQPGDQPFPPNFSIPLFGAPDDRVRATKAILDGSTSGQDSTSVELTSVASDGKTLTINVKNSMKVLEGEMIQLACIPVKQMSVSGDGFDIEVRACGVIFPPRNGLVQIYTESKGKLTPCTFTYDLRKKNSSGTYTLTNMKVVDEGPGSNKWPACAGTIKAKDSTGVRLSSMANQNITLTATGYSGPERVTRELAANTIAKEGTRKPKGRITHDDDHHLVTSDESKEPIKKTSEGIELGRNVKYAFGGLWYKGTKRDINIYCIDGECELGTGMRIFFTVQFTKRQADGFVYALPSGALNTYNSIGGDSAMGELLAYAGDSRVYPSADGSYSEFIQKWVDPERNGIQPPKIGTEFDTARNYNGGNYVCAVSSGQWDNTRIDPDLGGSTQDNHIAYVFWGDDTGGSGCTHGFDCKDQVSTTGQSATLEGLNTYDDNMHGRDSSTPNGLNLGGASNVFTATNDMQKWFTVQSTGSTRRYAVRIEVHRAIRPDDDPVSPHVGTYGYKVKTWVYRFDGIDWKTIKNAYHVYNYSNPYLTNDNFLIADLNRDLTTGAFDSYCAAGKISCPVLVQSFWLETSLHELLNTILLGFTQGTGASTQFATIHDYEVKFRSPSDMSEICSYPLKADALTLCK